MERAPTAEMDAWLHEVFGVDAAGLRAAQGASTPTATAAGDAVAVPPVPASPPQARAAQTSNPPAVEAATWRRQHEAKLAELRAAIGRADLSGPAAQARTRLVEMGRSISAALAAGDVIEASASLAAADADLRIVAGVDGSAAPAGTAAAPQPDAAVQAGQTGLPQAATAAPQPAAPPVGQSATAEPLQSVQWREQNKRALDTLAGAIGRVAMPGPAAAAQGRLRSVPQALSAALATGDIKAAAAALQGAQADVAAVTGQADAAMLPVTPGAHPDQVLFGKETTNAWHSGPADARDIDLGDVNQGGVGDCFLLAVLADVAKIKPDVVRGMIKDNGNGIYAVTFHKRRGGLGGFFASLFGGREFEPVQVVVDSNFGTNTANSGPQQAQAGTQHEIWVQVVEKAYAKLNGGYDQITHGGWPKDAMQAVTGQKAGQKPLASVTVGDLQAALATGKPVVMDTLAQPGPNQRLAFGMVGPHAYVLDSIQVNPKGQAMIILKNPWGTAHPPPIPFSQLGQSVGWVETGGAL